MGTTHAQRLAQAEATARRWLRALEALAVTDASDEAFCLMHRSWQGAERAVALQRAGAPPPPPGRRS